MRTLLACLFVLLASAMPARAQSERDGYARAEAALRALMKVPAGQFGFHLTVRGQDAPLVRTGTVAFRRAGHDVRLRIEDEEGVWGVGAHAAWMLSHRTGKVYVDSTGQSFRASTAVVQLLNPVLMPTLLSAYVIGAGAVNVEPGADCTTLEAFFDPPRNQVRHLRYCLDAQNRPVALDYTFDDGSGLTLALHDYDFDAPVEDARFDAPAGVPVVQADASDADLLAPGVDAPAFTLATADGAAVTLDDLRGQVVLLDFWGTWCGPCLEAIPHLQDLQARYADRGLVVLGVSAHEADEADPAAVAAARGATYRVLTHGEAIVDAYGVHSFPTYYVVGRDGAVRYATLHPDGYAELEAALAAALAE